MNVGFTGTQLGMTRQQELILENLLIEYRRTGRDQSFHHGHCIGADAQAHEIAYSLMYFIVSHPSTHKTKTAKVRRPSHKMLEPKDPLKRNQDIVNASEILIATPNQYEEVQRSGTWSTIRRARKKGIPRRIIFPNGTVSEDKEYDK